ncbi:hypothetical protein RAMLITH_05975 [Ramlibacter sp. RBP-2]|uniref:AbiV family abortive infection protein n=1 Tax=Ramlibacter lithotrophicus TaxID=2606681 RepID=A0A7X6DDZ5_9BURK|nr:hypothetical protein [Ramlibacter lithotrophicus]NKE65362.1 hypothetical protein [Ramlibacter lithotrophicus]
MATTFKLDSGAVDYLNWIGRSIHECDLPANSRVRAAASCLAIAQDHHHAIVVLLDHSLFASSLSLVRCEFEAYVRGEWLALCATDDEVEAFTQGAEPPPMRTLLEQLEQTPAFSAKVLSKIKANAWKAMCAYTHTGGLHIQRWVTEEAIEPNYSADEIQEVLSFAETVGSLAVVGVAYLANDDKVAESVLAKFTERTERRVLTCQSTRTHNYHACGVPSCAGHFYVMPHESDSRHARSRR